MTAIIHIRFEVPAAAEDLALDLRRLLEDFTPRVQFLPPDSARLDVTGARRFWGRDARGIAQVIQLRAAALYGVRSAAGTASSPMLAAMAAALAAVGQVLTVGHGTDEIRTFLHPRPARELPGVGATTAATLARFGLYAVGDVAAVPLHTLQRLLGARAGRALYDRARGHDVSVVDSAPLPRSISAQHRFGYDELDAAQHRRVLLALSVELGARLRAAAQIAEAVSVTVAYADRSATTRSRVLPEASHHTVFLGRGAYAAYETLGLQRARVRGITLRADGLRAADRATRQLTLDARDDKQLLLEAVADRARARFGDGVLYPAALAAAPTDRRRSADGIG
ncbi:DNA polymerase Y family protein [Streptomyces sp. NPDC002817]|uniref:DNA polymerase Y family protein n=1 Tax=Streptomyces sp. NPDC088357 TaxID=3154655 RepID=UPI00342DA8C9